jgi:ApaG domain
MCRPTEVLWCYHVRMRLMRDKSASTGSSDRSSSRSSSIQSCQLTRRHWIITNNDTNHTDEVSKYQLYFTSLFQLLLQYVTTKLQSTFSRVEPISNCGIPVTCVGYTCSTAQHVYIVPQVYKYAVITTCIYVYIPCDVYRLMV